jgi:hypothetical protein
LLFCPIIRLLVSTKLSRGRNPSIRKSPHLGLPGIIGSIFLLRHCLCIAVQGLSHRSRRNSRSVVIPGRIDVYIFVIRDYAGVIKLCPQRHLKIPLKCPCCVRNCVRENLTLSNSSQLEPKWGSLKYNASNKQLSAKLGAAQSLCFRIGPF